MRHWTCLHLVDGDQIRCEHRLSEAEPQGYPVIVIDGEKQSLNVLPTPGRLRRLYDAIGAYIMAHPDASSPGADGLAIEARWIVRDGDRVFSRDGRPVLFEDRADAALVAAMFEPDGSADRTDILPVPAEAAIVDSDELLESMASSYEVRRGAWEDEPTIEELEAAGRNRPRQVP